jgi:hypothetical protein
LKTAAALVGVSLLAAVTGLVAGTAAGFWLGKRTSFPGELIALAFSGEHCRLAFEHAEAEAAREALVKHRDLVTEMGRSLGEEGMHLELMVTNARLAIVSKEAGLPDGVHLSAAVDECRKARLRDCSPSTVPRLAGKRLAAGHP